MSARNMQSHGSSRPGVTVRPTGSFPQVVSSPDSSVESDLKTPSSDQMHHTTMKNDGAPAYTGKVPQGHSAAAPAVVNNVRNNLSDDYFQGHSMNSSDYIIDIWSDIDPLTFPPDVQAYLEACSRSYYGTNESTGRSHLFELEEQDILPPTPYSPTRDTLLLGIKVLRQLHQSGQGLFFPPGHRFSDQALREYPHYPWLWGLDSESRSRIADMENPPFGPTVPSKAPLLFGNVRLGLPAGLPGPATNPYWVQLVGCAYGDTHPAGLSIANPDFDDRAIDVRVRAGVSGLGCAYVRDPNDYETQYWGPEYQ